MSSMVKKRHEARVMLLQSLYQWQLSGNDTAEIIASALEHQIKAVDTNYFRDLMYAITESSDQLDAAFVEFLDRPLQEIDPIERSILWTACYELSERLDIPYRVVINEALNNAKKFGATDSYKYINGVLDKLARKLREFEIKETPNKRK